MKQKNGVLISYVGICSKCVYTRQNTLSNKFSLVAFRIITYHVGFVFFNPNQCLFLFLESRYVMVIFLFWVMEGDETSREQSLLTWILQEMLLGPILQPWYKKLAVAHIGRLPRSTVSFCCWQLLRILSHCLATTNDSVTWEVANVCYCQFLVLWL